MKNAQLFAELIKTSIKSIAGAQLFFKLLKLGYNITIAVKEQSKKEQTTAKGEWDDKNGTANVCGLNFKGCSQRDVPKSTKLIRAETRSAQKGWQLLPSARTGNCSSLGVSLKYRITLQIAIFNPRLSWQQLPRAQRCRKAFSNYRIRQPSAEAAAPRGRWPEFRLLYKIVSNSP